MAITLSARLGLTRWGAQTDPFRRAQLDADNGILDSVVAMYAQGLFNARPAFGKAGRFYYATDTSTLYYDTGVAWVLPAPNTVTTDTAQTISGVKTFTARPTVNNSAIVDTADARLGDARTPTAHSHAMADLPAAAAALAAYPVGAVYTSFVSTSPDTLFGGTWVAISDRVLVGVGANVRWDTAGEIGGSETVTLTAAQSGSPAHAHTASQAAHSHTTGVDQGFTNAFGNDSTLHAIPLGKAYVGNGAMGGSSATPAVTVNNSAAANASAAHDNMPPFMAVHMWRRTA